MSKEDIKKVADNSHINNWITYKREAFPIEVKLTSTTKEFYNLIHDGWLEKHCLGDISLIGKSSDKTFKLDLKEIFISDLIQDKNYDFTLFYYTIVARDYQQTEIELN